MPVYNNIYRATEMGDASTIGNGDDLSYPRSVNRVTTSRQAFRGVKQPYPHNTNQTDTPHLPRYNWYSMDTLASASSMVSSVAR